MPATRQLSAILFTDIEGYSALLQLNEQKGLALRNRHREVVQKEHQHHNGRVVQFYGDGTLSVFPSAVDAVQCAIAMQQAFGTNPTVPVRMGLHIGDIIFDDEQVFGNGVNLASRIESLAVAGSVLISDKVNDEIKNQPQFRTISMGTYQLKNIQEEVEVFALDHDGLKVPIPNSLQGKTQEKKTSELPRPRKPRLRHNSIAVLPFRNISADSSIEWLSNGFTEELTSAIAGISGLKVKSSTAMRQYKNSALSFAELSEEVNVANFIEGNIQKEGNNVLISAHLIETKSGEILRPFTFKKDFSEINFIYSQMAREVADDLNVLLNNSEKKRLQQITRVHAEAHQLYLQGRFKVQKFDSKEIWEAVNLFTRALQKAPEYAQALAGLAQCYIVLGYLNALTSSEALAKAMPLLDKALLLNPNVSFAYTNLGWAKLWFQWNLTEAEEQFRKGNELDPSDINSIQGIAFLNLYLGNISKSQFWCDNGQAVAPNDSWINLFEGILLFLDGRVSEAIEFLENYIHKFNHPFLSGRLGWIYAVSGHYEKAIAVIEDALDQYRLRRPALLASLAGAYFKNGEKEKAFDIISELEKKIEEGKANHAYYTAAVYAFIGNTQKALHFLYKAYDQHDVELLWFKVDPMMNSVKSLPFCVELLKKTGLE